MPKTKMKRFGFFVKFIIRFGLCKVPEIGEISNFFEMKCKKNLFGFIDGDWVSGYITQTAENFKKWCVEIKKWLWDTRSKAFLFSKEKVQTKVQSTIKDEKGKIHKQWRIEGGSESKSYGTTDLFLRLIARALNMCAVGVEV